MFDTSKNAIEEHLNRSADIKRTAAGVCSTDAAYAASAITKALQQGGKLMICGNGGSAADAQHIAAEFVVALDHHNLRKPLAAIALTTDTSLITACANDLGFDDVFARQCEALGRDGDVLLGLSTSGNSPNIIRAIHVAKKKNITTIALTGGSGGETAGLADIVIAVPSSSTQHIQETHIALGHAIVATIEKNFA